MESRSVKRVVDSYKRRRALTFYFFLVKRASSNQTQVKSAKLDFEKEGACCRFISK